ERIVLHKTERVHVDVFSRRSAVFLLVSRRMELRVQIGRELSFNNTAAYSNLAHGCEKAILLVVGMGVMGQLETGIVRAIEHSGKQCGKTFSSKLEQAGV